MTQKYCYILLLLITAQNAFADSSKPGLSLPRFVSLRSNNINVHVGPGTNYPIEWKYVRQHLPVEILAEFDTWRKVRDVDGAESWVHKSLLTSRRYGIILQKIRNLRDQPDQNSKIKAKLEPGVIVRLIECNTAWCKVESKSTLGCHKGWLKRSAVWGIYPDEAKFK